MKIINRKGEHVRIAYEAVRDRLLSLCSEQDVAELDIDSVVLQTMQGIHEGVTTTELDHMSARICASLQATHYLYGDLAGRILVTDLHKNLKHQLGGGETDPSFATKTMYVWERTPSVLAPDYVEFVRDNADVLESMIRRERDLSFSFFAFKTLERSYLLRVDDKIVETPQDMFMRVAVAIHMKSRHALEAIKDTYELMSEGYFTHATPTLFNAGTRHPQMSSCYLQGTEDSLSSIFKTVGDCAQVSKWAGGIGLHVSNLRSRGSIIKSTSGKSDGIIPLMKVLNEVCRYVNQAGRRKGSIAVYLEPWHADIWEFVELRRNTGAETERARDLFLALWVPDAFMRAVVDDGDWYLMSPDECPGLTETYGEAFDTLYRSYVDVGKYVRKIKAQKLWIHILESQIETGTPYVMYKDHVNRKTNQQNVGTIKSSNLCAEICEYSDAQSYAVCNLASIAVNKFVKTDGTYDHEKLHEVAKVATRNLNKIIDINFYPVDETRKSNMSLRPIGLGIQGLGDTYCLLNLPYASEAAMRLDREIMETIYHGALEASTEISELVGPYDAFDGSPFSQGQLQHDMWAAVHDKPVAQYESGRWDWNRLRARVVKSGTRNSLVTALMPTASTSQILGNCEMFEPFSSNAYRRTTLAGEFMVVNRHLQRKLMDLGLWTDDMKTNLMMADGSVQSIAQVPEDVREVYRTIWEVSQRAVIDHAVARGPFVDQSQSMNLFFAQPNFQRLSSALIYGWKSGLKTAMYYLRSKPATEAQKFAIAPPACETCSA
jgi:ribonucleoside-diphosphate reductase alpha chain